MEDAYYNPARSSSFWGSVGKFGQRPADEALRWLESQNAYTLHGPVRRVFRRRHYDVSNMDDLWEADLMDVRSLKRYNDNYTYVLAVIDVLSKHAWTEPLRNKSSQTVADAFERILERATPRAPLTLQTDRGREFTGSGFQRLLKRKKIRFRLARSDDVKAAVVERFNRTWRERAHRYFTRTGGLRYVDAMQDLAQSYNDSVHSTIEMPPSSVNAANVDTARANMLRNRTRGLRPKTPKYEVGDRVRISNAKTAFERGYRPRWSEETFVVDRVQNHRPPPVYVIRDRRGEEIDGIFYEPEMRRVR